MVLCMKVSWKNNKRDGKGVYKWSNGDVYDGDWKDNRPNGQGTLKTVAGMQYKGGFVDGLEDGSRRTNRQRW